MYFGYISIPAKGRIIILLNGLLCIDHGQTLVSLARKGRGEILHAMTLDVYNFFNKLKPRNLVTFLTFIWEQFGIASTCPSSLTFDRSFF